MFVSSEGIVYATGWVIVTLGTGYLGRLKWFHRWRVAACRSVSQPSPKRRNCPLGYDWKMGVGLVAAFAAREVFVSTGGILYATGGDTDAGTDTLQKAMHNAHYANGKPVWTPLVAVSLLIWFVLAIQCMNTVAIVKRETGGWGWPIFMTLYVNGLAYVVCLIVFQVGTHLGL